MEIDFFDPSGQRVRNPAHAVLRKAFLEPDEGYWDRGASDAMLRVDGGEAQIVFSCVEKKQFCVVFERGSDGASLVLSGKGPTNLIERVKLSGNVVAMPQSYLVDGAEAYSTAIWFLEHRALNPAGKWVTFEPEVV